MLTMIFAYLSRSHINKSHKYKSCSYSMRYMKLTTTSKPKQMMFHFHIKIINTTKLADSFFSIISYIFHSIYINLCAIGLLWLESQRKKCDYKLRILFFSILETNMTNIFHATRNRC